jgi:hypothetical protein
MTIIIIVAVAFVVAIIAYIVGRVNATEPLPRCCFTEPYGFVPECGCPIHDKTK